MNVAELIQELEKYPEDLQVVVPTKERGFDYDFARTVIGLPLIGIDTHIIIIKSKSADEWEEDV